MSLQTLAGNYIQEDDNLLMINGTWHRIRVVSVVKGQKLKRYQVNFYYGRVDQLTWDPGRICWPSGIPLMSYSTKMERELLRKRHIIPNIAEQKWSGILPPSLEFKWKHVWNRSRTRKEAGLFWTIWHLAVPVNKWRGHIDIQRRIRVLLRPPVNQVCPTCNTGLKETVLHRFWECRFAQNTWAWGTFIINKVTSDRAKNSRWAQFNWKQGIFNSSIPRRFKDVANIWLVLRSTILWALWSERNDIIFKRT
jgi:hypothetical protein